VNASNGDRKADPCTYLFFVSYGHTPPTGDNEDADYLVGEFFDDLSNAVAYRAGRRGARTGFIDRELAAGSNWTDNLGGALEDCEVFVPLYSPRYFASSAAGREWTAFRKRLELAGVADPDRRYLPVLWVPLPSGFPMPEAARSSARTDDFPSYRENGLQALCRRPRFRSVYSRVIGRLADRVVELAVREPVGRSRVPEVGDAELAFPRDHAAPPFVIAVAAATAKSARADEAGHYGASGVDWRPFGVDEKLPLTAYGATIAERFQFSPVVAELDSAAAALETAPGVVLIDPWLTDEEHAEVLRAVTHLPPWTLTAVIADGADPRLDERAERRIDRIKQSATDVDPGSAEPLRWGRGDTSPRPTPPGRAQIVQRATRGIASLADFEKLFPILVTDAARRYKAEGPIHRDGPAEAAPAHPSADAFTGKHSDD
jgi:TIR domain